MFLAGVGAVLVALALVSVHAAGAGPPVIEAHGGNVELNGNDIQNIGELSRFFDTECSGSQVVSQVFDNGSYRCSDASTTLSGVLSSDNSAGSHNIDMNGNNISNVGWVNPGGGVTQVGGRIHMNDSRLVTDSAVSLNGVQTTAISSEEFGGADLSLDTDGEVKIRADRDGTWGGPHVWSVSEATGKLSADGDLNMSDNWLSNVANPLDDADVTDRGYNDGRSVELSGDTMSGNLDMGAGNIEDVGIVFANTLKTPTTSANDMFLNSDNALLLRTDSDGSAGGPYDWEFSETDGSLSGDGNIIKDVSQLRGKTANGQNMEYNTDEPVIKNNDNGQTLSLQSYQDVSLEADIDDSNYVCYIDDSDGSWNCGGSKDWIHSLNATHEAVYSAQESPQVRAVIEDTVTVEDGETMIELPEHFSGTVGTDADMTVQVTPHSLATVAAVQRNTTHVTVAADRDVGVDYRVTGIRAGYEDKQVVQPQAEN